MNDLSAPQKLEMMARLALARPEAMAAQLPVLADQCRRHGLLERAVELLDAHRVVVPHDQSAATLRAALCGLPEAGPEDTSASRPTPFVRVKNFLPEETVALILDQAVLDVPALQDSQVDREDYSGVDEKTRRSLILPDPRFYREFILPPVVKAMTSHRADAVFGLDLKRPDTPSLQMTFHGDGGFFAPHTDLTASVNNERQISFVYYVNRTPKAFSGGELVLFDGSRETERYSADAFTLVEPLHNSLILFPSFTVHEVRPIHSAIDDLSFGRITLNGWFH